MYKFILLTVFCVMAFNAKAVKSDYLVVSWTAENGLVAEYHEVVELAGNFKNKSSAQSSDNVILFGQDGTIVDQVSALDAKYTRSEHHGHQQIDGQLVLNEQITFVIRAPKGKVKNLSLPFNMDKNQSLLDFNELVEHAKLKADKPPVEIKGAVDNRINLLILGDGYTANQENDFNNDADSVIAYMQTFEPYENYSEFISYDRVFTSSNDSGADKPAACFDGDAVTVDTAFDGSYCIANIRRLLTVNSSKIFTAAAASPDWDEIIVIVNDDEYGGSGGGFSTFSTNEFANDIFIHEYGHTFTRLADEYDSPFPGFPACSDINGSSCEANVTDETSRNNIKWNYFIAQNTPVPTPETSQFSNVIGIFEGARYLETGMYRPKNECNMKVLAVDFCAVCQEAYVFRLYDVLYAGGSRLSLIEPETASPADLTPSGMVSVTQSFSIETLQPSHDLNVVWSVNGQEQVNIDSSSTTQSFNFTPTQTGNNTIEVTIKDSSPLVHSSRLDELPEFTLTWQVNVDPFVDLIFEDGFE